MLQHGLWFYNGLQPGVGCSEQHRRNTNWGLGNAVDMASVQQAAVALSAIVATFTFLYKVLDDRSSRRESEILDWQKTVVHSIFQKNKSPWLSFETIIGSYRGEAADVPNKRLPREVLTSAALRKILIAMVADRIIDQRGGDEYQLLTFNRDESHVENYSQAMAKSMSSMISAMNESMGKSRESAREINLEMAQIIAGKVLNSPDLTDKK